MGGSKKTTYKKKLPMNLQMNTYELNKIAYAKLPVLTQASPERGAALQILAKYIQDHNNQYFMFLNNDVHYYTIFNIQDTFEESIYSALDDCIQAIGGLISVEFNETTDACECWFKVGDEALMYVFFVYDMGVIECHK